MILYAKPKFGPLGVMESKTTVMVSARAGAATHANANADDAMNFLAWRAPGFQSTPTPVRAKRTLADMYGLYASKDETGVSDVLF